MTQGTIEPKPGIDAMPGVGRLGKPLRILYVETNEDDTVGGSHQAMFDLARNLDRNDFEPHVLFYQNNVFADRLRQLGISVHSYERERMAERAEHRPGRRVARLLEVGRAIRRRLVTIRRLGIDLVHLNNHPCYGCEDWLPACKLARIPCVVNTMGEPGPDSAWHRRLLVRHYDRVIAISQFMCEQTVRNHGIARERIATISLSLDAEAYRARVRRSPADVRRELRLDDDRLLCVMVGNIRHWKGQHVVLRSLVHLSASVRERLQVVFIGATSPEDVEYGAELEETIDREGLRETVRFLGWRQDTPDYVNAADICIHASVSPEPFGLVILEAMVLGRPLIASNRGGPAEIITPGCGLLFDADRPVELADHLATLAGDPGLRQCFGLMAQRRAAEFSLPANVAANVEVYRSVLHRR